MRDEFANLEFESMSKEEIVELYKFGRIQYQTKLKLTKQKMIEAVKEEKNQIGLSYQNDEIERAYFDGRDDQCNTFLKLIEEILPNE